MKKLSNTSILLILVCLLGTISCKKDKDNEPDPVEPPPSNVDGFGLGWFGDDDLDSTPASVNVNFGGGDLPAAVDLVPIFPPIGDQGQYGTCVSWAVGYNTKTALAGLSNNWSASDLASPANQSSPKDLFTAIPDNQKGPDCNGTNFTNALDLIQSRGVASSQTVPYTNLGNCSQSNVQGSWTSEAQNNKIEYWRKIDPTIESIKDNLSKNIPVILGAKLGDNFMAWNSDNVLSSESSFNNAGQHAYHAMVIAGYDNSKGAGGAFKVINSWGQSWGDQGYIWVDYNYLINEFCTGGNGEKPLFIASNVNGGDDNTPPDEGGEPTSNGVDLAPWVFGDYSTQNWDDYTERVIDLNIYNIGAQTASASDDWNIYYVYFNAYDANEYGVIFYDEFNTSIAANTIDCSAGDYCTINLDIPSGSDFGYEAFNEASVIRTYYMPQITGYYYLALVVDASNVFLEQDELNNIFYTTMEPKYFDTGYSKAGGNKPGKFAFENTMQLNNTNLQRNVHNSAVTPENPNAYTTREITKFLQEEKRSGRLDEKLRMLPKKANQTIYKL